MKRTSALLAVLLAACLTACEWFSTMSDPASIEPHERAPMLPPPNAVALDGSPDFDLTNADQRLANPRPSSPTSLEIGRAHYDTFCAVCHGPSGRGDGPLTQKFPAIPAIATARVAGYTDPYIFALISKGRGLMPEYSRIPPTARWDVVNYVRTLPPGAGATGTVSPTTGAAPTGAAPAPVAPSPVAGADTAGGGR